MTLNPSLLYIMILKKRKGVKPILFCVVYRKNLSVYFLFLTDIVLTLKNPIALILIGKNFDLIQRSNVCNLILSDYSNKSPVSKKTCNAVTTLNIVYGQVCMFAIKSKQFLKVNNIISTLLMKKGAL